MIKVIKEAWVESGANGILKLCVRYEKDGAETLGCFGKHHNIIPKEYEGLKMDEACRKFNKIVYPRYS